MTPFERMEIADQVLADAKAKFPAACFVIIVTDTNDCPYGAMASNLSETATDRQLQAAFHARRQREEQPT
jgi:hypothetical protein